MNVLANIQYVLPILINGIILKYLYRLDKIKCICSDLPEKDHLINAYWIFIGLSTLNLINLPTYIGTTLGGNNIGMLKIGFGLLVLYLIYVIYILITSIKFVKKLKNIQCSCSENWKREFMYISNIISISILFLSIIIIIIAAIVIITLGSNKLLSNIINESKKL
jgi:hypothetical protein